MEVGPISEVRNKFSEQKWVFYWKDYVIRSVKRGLEENHIDSPLETKERQEDKLETLLRHLSAT